MQYAVEYVLLPVNVLLLLHVRQSWYVLEAHSTPQGVAEGIFNASFELLLVFIVIAVILTAVVSSFANLLVAQIISEHMRIYSHAVGLARPAHEDLAERRPR